MNRHLKKYTINICSDCLNLEGEMCHDPECVFIRETMEEVKHYLDVLMIAPLGENGERLFLREPASMCEDGIDMSYDWLNDPNLNTSNYL